MELLTVPLTLQPSEIMELYDGGIAADLLAGTCRVLRE